MHQSRRLFFSACVLALTGCTYSPGHGATVTAGSQGVQTVNDSVLVPIGEKSGDVETVKGDIRVGAGAAVDSARTIKGNIDLSRNSTADSLNTLNGSISLGESARVLGPVISIVGAVTLRSGSAVVGGIANVSGNIQLTGAHVSGGIRTFGGDIYVGSSSHVEGGILVEQPTPHMWMPSLRPPRIVIGPGSVVQGELTFNRKVQLYVSEKAMIGPVTGATAIRYSGASPVLNGSLR